jgi:5-hydroxyisourate hydrolase
MTAKNPITCHVLDTLTGRPAKDVTVTLSYAGSQEIQSSRKTDSDGRISNWHSLDNEGRSLDQFLASLSGTAPKPSVWKLTFNTGDYYGLENTFWPQVDITFSVRQGEHYHVPLLLGPYSYTTYRGS